MTTKLAPVIIANWKMNGLLLESMQLFKALRQNIQDNLISCKVVLCPPATLLRDLAEKTPGTGVKLGGQNCHFAENGAFTGEISAPMLKDMTCDYVILGHSERRGIFNEDSVFIQQKAQAANKAGLISIICVGETIEEREAGKAEEVVKQQVLESIPETANPANTVIAYEPVWAIGTNKVPTEQEIGEMHQFITKTLQEENKNFTSKEFSVVYGGSANGDNAKQILSIEGVGGLLVGRASLDAEQFWNIIQAAG